MAVNGLAARNWGPAAKGVVKGVLTLVVLAFVARHVAATRRDLSERGLSLRLDPAWLSASVGLYLLGLLAFGVYFWRVLAASESPVGFYPAVRAYLISHLAKYVPGKAMVVVVRSALVVPDGARPATSAFATLYETLVMMAAGGWVAAAGFALGNRSSGPATRISLPWDRTFELDLPFAALGMMAGLGFMVLVWPSVFPRLAGLIRKPLRGVGADALPRFSPPLLLEGLAWTTLGWGCLGMSQVAVIAGIGLALGVGDWPLAAASVALATVAGFAVPIAPGGLGVREWVLWTALATTLDRDWAVVAALVLRLAWVVGEVGVAVALISIVPRSRRSPG